MDNWNRNMEARRKKCNNFYAEKEKRKITSLKKKRESLDIFIFTKINKKIIFF